MRNGLCTHGSIEMDFVPAGYSEGEEDQLDDEFDFGDSYTPGQFVQDPIVAPEVKQAASLTISHQQEAGNEKEDCHSMSKAKDGRVCSRTPAKGQGAGGRGKGSLASSDCYSEVSQSSSDLCLNHAKADSPVTFNISNSPQESLGNSDEDTSPGKRNIPEPSNTLTSSHVRERSCDRGVIKSSGQLKSLEREEDLKVALTRGNVEHVSRMLEEGGYALQTLPILPLYLSSPCFMQNMGW
jgi:hypothetical protein